MGHRYGFGHRQYRRGAASGGIRPIIRDGREYCIDAYTQMLRPWMEPYAPKRTNGRYSSYWTLTAQGREASRILNKCARHHIRTRCYESCWGRSGDYRAAFIKQNPGPYVCAYCGKPIPRDKMVVDHIVPVAKTKSSRAARRRLKKQGIYNVNDVRNLTASCSRCNLRKSDRMGFWLVKARHGTEKWFQDLLKGLRIAGICAAAAAVILAIFFIMRSGVFM